jgi:hypothetical protein
MKCSLRSFAFGVVSLATLTASPAFSATNAVVGWNKAILEAIRVTRPGPTVVARALNITSTCGYDAWAAYDNRAIATQSGNKLRRPAGERTDANKNEAVNYAIYRAAIDLFPTEKASFDALLTSSGFDPNNNSTNPATASGVGNLSCAAVLAFRHRDGSNQLGDLHAGAYSDYTGYRPINTPTNIIDPNNWQPLSIPNGQGGFVTQNFLTPHWGKVKPFALRSIYQYRIKRPARAGTRAYEEQAKEVVQYSANLTDYQKVIAEYWADGPKSELPPGHWNLFAQYISERDGHTLSDDVKMFFELNNALLDASIWVWGVKREFDYIRPVSAVHYLFADTLINAWAGPGLGTRAIMGSDWRPYQAANVVTPPFAEYVSGHSTFSAAAATVLQRFTDSDVFGFEITIPAGSSRVEPGVVPASAVTLSWATFSDAANEAGLSRRYGGIHFKDGDLEARRVGGYIGDAAVRGSDALIGGRHRRDINVYYDYDDEQTY